MTESADDFYLEMSTGAGPAVRRDLIGSRLSIGRAAECDIPLESTRVSRRHAELEKDAEGNWHVRDLSSRNGTRVNGRPVAEQVLHHGDRIYIGEFEFRFRSRSAPANVAAAGSNNTVWAAQGGSTTLYTTLSEAPVARLAQEQLALVSGLSAKLVEIAEEGDRMTYLCRSLVESEVRCDAAAVLQVDRADAQAPPRMLCALQMRASAREAAGTNAPAEVSRAVVEAAVTSQQPILAGDSEAQDRACIVCPLRVEKQEADILYVVVPREQGTVDWLALVALAAEQFKKAQLQIEARRTVQASAELHHDLKKARQMQMNLVPKNPAVPGLEVSIGFEPCNWIGGDYANVISGPDGRVLLVVADASGKGMAAAMIASGVHSIIHSAIRSGTEIQDMVLRLNEFLVESMDRQSFVTLTGAMLDPHTGAAKCVNAGHPPMLVVDPDGKVTELPYGHNPPLGVMPMNVELDVAELQPGQLLVMFTDGLTELREPGRKMLGLEGLSARVSALYAENPGVALCELCGKLNAWLDEIRGACPSTDDRTFLLARRGNPSA
ncbi:MAG: SpoIIE family protein phosphatase [Tepidisphaeraceae bacterium]|jgi:serine phosphatase RsbU (regulator of sigma subunit)/pSer/pThr/pTyr-binding forkhead associated (FHA) protein